MEDILGACGLLCSSCEAYIATCKNDSEAIAEIAEKWSRKYGISISPESVWCDGCLTQGDRKCGHCAECEVRACVISRGLSNCAECDYYLCKTITRFFELQPLAKHRLDRIRLRIKSVSR